MQDIKIDDVNKSLWHYILNRKRIEFISMIFTAIIWEVIGIVFVIPSLIANGDSSNNNSTGKAIAFIIAAPFILIMGWINRLRLKFEEAFLEEFAQSNGFNFTKTGSVDETYGTIFRLSGEQATSDIITGVYRGNDLRLFLYQLTTGSGRNKTVRSDTVIELDLHGQLPNLLMVNRKSHLGQISLAGSFGTSNKIGLEGDFNKYFTLYAPADTQIEALEVFSPDTMALMEDHSRHYTVEFAANRIYIYANGLITTSEELTGLFALAKQLIDKIGPVASRLANDSTLVVPPVNLPAPGEASPQSLRTEHRLVMIIIVTVVFVFVFVALVSLISALSQP